MEELFDGSPSGQEGLRNGGLCTGTEIDAVPLCANCVVETEVDELDEDAVLQKGLRRMDHTDGGLGRMRWERQRSERLRSRRSQEVKPLLAVAMFVC